MKTKIDEVNQMIKKEIKKRLGIGIRYILIASLISLIIYNLTIPANAANGAVTAKPWDPINGKIEITIMDGDKIFFIKINGTDYQQKVPQITVVIKHSVTNIKDFPLKLLYIDAKNNIELWEVDIDGKARFIRRWTYQETKSGKGLSIISIIGLTGILTVVTIIRIRK